MATIHRYRQIYARLHRRYERQALKVLFGVFDAWGKSIQWDIMTPFNYTAVLELNIDQDLILTGYFDIYNTVGREHGTRIGASINGQLKNFTLENFNSAFTREVGAWIRANLMHNIFSVRRTYLEFITKEIREGLENGEGIEEITSRLRRVVRRRNFYRWQAQRIARTETTTASNFGASVASNISGFVMQKVWIATRDHRTRRPPKSEYNHLAMDEVRVGQNDLFNVNGDLVRFPADPKGQAGNTINCRCTVAIVPARDRQGNLIET